ncbi:hypothetical protein GCM10027285_07690 [Oleiagrimonas citrea]
MGDDAGANSSRSFKFGGLWFPLLVLACMLVSFVVVLVVSLVQERGVGVGMVAILILAIAFLTFIGRIYAFARADMVLDDGAVSRALFGKIVQSIDWRNVAKIKVFPLRKSGNKVTVTGYNIMPRDHSMTRPKTRKIYFSRHDNDYAELLDALNEYVRRHNIIVERVVNGVTTTSNQV